MNKACAYLVPVLFLAAVGCDGAWPVDPAQSAERFEADVGPSTQSGIQASATGGGHFTIAGVLDVQFSMSAVQTSPDGSATGRARHSIDFEGELVEFHTRVTCVTFDAGTGRAWIGGVITRNNSTHPAFLSDVHEVGDDIWFRVVDYGEGEGAGQPDRSTFVGFEGSAGIITSEEYCETRPWPEGDARTNPVTEGNIQVRAP